MKFAFVTDELPKPGIAGHLAFNHAIISWLRGLGHHVTVVMVRPRLSLPVERYREAPVQGPGLLYWRGHVVCFNLREIAAILARRATGLLPAPMAAALRKRARSRHYGSADAVLGAFPTPAQLAWCQSHLVATKPDALLVDTIFRAPILASPALAGFNSVLLTHDLFHIRHRALASAGYQVFPAGLSQQLEAHWLNQARTIAAIQPDEAATIRAMCPARSVITTPMPALPCPRPEGRVRLRGRLVFVGGDSLPNLDGLRWFFSEIWPRLQHENPSLTLDLAGDCGAAFASLPPGVNPLGRVANLSCVLHRASLAIAPLRAGSGLNIKMLDYARHGLVTIATPTALQGLAKDATSPFITAESPLSFALAISQYCQNSANAPASTQDEQNALNYIHTHCGTQKSFASLATALGLAPQKTTAPANF